MSVRPKRYVYLLRSSVNRDWSYVGLTADVGERIRWHNVGPSDYTLRGRPWELVVVLEFASENTARAFERYLKSGSGRAFAKRHFGAPAKPAGKLSGDTTVGDLVVKQRE